VAAEIARLQTLSAAAAAASSGRGSWLKWLHFKLF
jgi:hypothetical protein